LPFSVACLMVEITSPTSVRSLLSLSSIRSDVGEVGARAGALTSVMKSDRSQIRIAPLSSPENVPPQAEGGQFLRRNLQALTDPRLSIHALDYKQGRARPAADRPCPQGGRPRSEVPASGALVLRMSKSCAARRRRGAVRPSVLHLNSGPASRRRRFQNALSRGDGFWLRRPTHVRVVRSRSGDRLSLSTVAGPGPYSQIGSNGWPER
jgi:hypothetical protein